MIKGKYNDTYFGKTRRSHKRGNKHITRPIIFDDVDFLIYRLPNQNIFYILPAEKMKKYKSGISFHPGIRRPHFSIQSDTENYKDKWSLITDFLNK